MIASQQAGSLSLSGIAFSLPDRTVDAHRWAERCGQPSTRARH